jgi:hypothetical protein
MKFASIVISLTLLAAPAMSMVTFAPTVLAATSVSKLGDLSSFHTIAADTLALSKKGDLVGAEKRISDFEKAWDAATADVYTRDAAQWGVIDGAADTAITSLRTKPVVASKASKAVSGLLTAIDNPAATAK